jgi:acyl-homoserine-lactone acylase
MTAPEHGFDVEVTWTTHGVPHIRATDWASLGYGQGWACTLDNPGLLADQAVKVRSERSRHLGRGVDDSNLATDLGYLALGMTARAEAMRDAQTPEIRDLVRGYVAGHNDRLAEARADGTLPAWCRDADWLGPITELDHYRVLVDVMILASGRSLIGLIGRAEAPGPDGPAAPAPMSAFGRPSEGAGSNGWAFGGDATASGGGVMLANPHFPWNGEARFWECHLRLDDPAGGDPVLDGYGVALVGTPSIQIGFNRDVAWTHTVSKGHRFTLARLDLVPGEPTRYRHGDETRDLVPTTHRIEVLGEDPVERTLWHSHHGPMVNLPLLGWGLEVGFTYRDANLDNTAAFATWQGMLQARSLDEFQQAAADHQGIPWVNTIAADRTGRAWYHDGSATPNLSADAQARFRERIATDPIAALLFENRVALVDGSDPGDDWVDAAGARDPGLVPHAEQPQLERRDFVVNANDSYWLVNQRAPGGGRSVFHGLDRVAPSQRTRANLLVAADLADGGAVTIDSVLDALSADTSLTADRLRDQVVERLRAGGLDEAADVLGRWDGRYTLTSAGGVLWRELMAHFSVAELIGPGRLYADAFDPDRPLDTPAALHPAPEDPRTDPLVAAAREALDLLDRAGITPDAPLGTVQWATRGTTRIPIAGGGEPDGVININSAVSTVPPTTVQPAPEAARFVPGRMARTGLAEGGYPIVYGASIVLAVDLGGPDGPTAKGLLAYGQSSDPDAPDAAVQTEAYSTGTWRAIAFTEEQIAADPQRRVRRFGRSA